MALKLQKYAIASLVDICQVLDAADELDAVISEFPDDHRVWGEALESLFTALEGCSGTHAFNHKQLAIGEHDE